MKFLLLFLFLATLAPADHPDEKPDTVEGHSNHGSAFNEGPRQAAYLMGETGDISFEFTTKSEDAKAFFLQAMGQLHGFWYFEAERSFRQVAFLDADCAMAYWGMAVANRDNEARARGFMRKALNRLEGVTPREKAYIEAFAANLGIPTDAEALAKIENMKEYKPKRSEKDRRGDYVKKLEELVLEYPEDIEAKALLVVQLWLNVRKGHPMNSTLAADALAQQVLAANANHPIHHYRIHLWDRRRAKTATESAAACGFAAPSIAHMWHMPGHIYDKLQRFSDAAWHQEASARVDHAHMMRDRVLPDQIHNFAHNNEWLTRNLMALGRVHEAIDLAQNMTELPRHPKWNTLKKGSAKYGRHRLYSIITSFELWERALELDGSYLTLTDVDGEKLRHHRLMARAKFATSDIAGGDAIISEIETLKAAITKKADEEHEKKMKEEKDEKKKAQKRKPNNDEKYATTTLTELRLAKALAEGRSKEALAEKDLKTNGVDDNLLLAMQVASEDFEKAITKSTDLVKKAKNRVQPLARHVLILHAAGKAEEAKKSFDELRALGQDIDLDMPIFQRLKPIAENFDYPRDWRQKRDKPDDIRKRPKLANLGPFRWHPSKAERFKLPDHTGKQTSLAQLNKDQNVLLIFYLGSGCLHCVQQLDAFAPKAKAFADAGIQIVGISIEDVDELRASVTKYSADDGGLGTFVNSFAKDGAFPFPLLANESLDVFKQWRAYDDFEQMPLHGTCLIDSRGYVRWQDISFEPFTKADFLLEESKRLLAQPADNVYEQVGLLRRLQFWRR